MNHDANIVAIIQGRMSSSRLPGKVLLDLAGKPMLQRVVERVGQSALVNSVVVATSDDPTDDPIELFCREKGYACHRGSLHDVLDRFYTAARTRNAGIIVRVTADCPFIDPGLIDQTIRLITHTGTDQPVDFSANRLPPPFHRTYPIGLDVEVCTYTALQTAWQNAQELFHREHVMPYLYEDVVLKILPNGNQAGVSKNGFSVAVLNHPQDLGEKRWTVDTQQDLQFARQSLEMLADTENFSWLDMLKTIEQHPELESINALVRHKSMKDVDERAKQ